MTPDEERKPFPERELSVVVPVYNNCRTLKPLHDRFEKAMASLTQSFEFVFVNDGGTDESLPILLGLHETKANVGMARFLPRNSLIFG